MRETQKKATSCMQNIYMKCDSMHIEQGEMTMVTLYKYRVKFTFCVC